MGCRWQAAIAYVVAWPAVKVCLCTADSVFKRKGQSNDLPRLTLEDAVGRRKLCEA